MMMRSATALLSCAGWAAATPSVPTEVAYDYQEHAETAFIDFAPKAGADDGVMQLVMMDDKGLSGMGAVCLDGTDAGFYFSPYSGGDENKNKWQLYFQGGGWCYDEMDCWGRSNGGLGSSKTWAKTASEGGIMSANCKTNPDYCNFNRVHMAYCDGNSFSGNAFDPITVNGKKIYFRGKRIIDAILQTLTEKYNFGAAETVLLTGCSAGGLATYLHTDYVASMLPSSVTKYGASPISGFFLLHNNTEGSPVYPTQMKHIFEIANSTQGVNAACIADKAPEDQWMCNFAQEAYNYTKSPIFPLNSALDSWQTVCIYAAELPANFPNQTGTENGVCNGVSAMANCAGNPENCDSTQMGVMNQYITDFETAMNSSATYSKAGNGAFIHSCHTHCEAQSAAWNSFKIGGVSMQEMNSKWWNSDFMQPAAQFTTSSCLYDATKKPHKCNPTC